MRSSGHKKGTGGWRYIRTGGCSTEEHGIYEEIVRGRQEGGGWSKEGGTEDRTGREGYHERAGR